MGEGLETALSIGQAGIGAKIICALGIYNIKNHIPAEGERIIIAADNDGEGAATDKTVAEACELLSKRGAVVGVARPRGVGDFNDILRSGGASGISEIREIFNPVIGDLKAENLPVRARLNDFKLQKERAETLQEVLRVTGEEQGFLSSLRGTAEYPDRYPRSLSDSIGKAYSSEREGTVRELYNVTGHIRGRGIIPEPDLILRIKASEDIGATVKELTETAVAHYDREVNKNINLLLKGGILEARGETFESPTIYCAKSKTPPTRTRI